MNLINKATSVLLGLFLTTSSFAQTAKPRDYLGVPGPVVFNKISYNLAWTSHPSDNYYKAEYLSKGDTLEHFQKLVMLDLIVGKMSVKDVVAIKIAELKKLKEANPVINYETFEKNGEIMLDFLMSENTADGKYLSIVERNVYRYKTVTDKNGQQGVLLFAVSERDYGDDIDQFFPNLKAHRFDLINAVGAFKLPEIVVAK